MNSSLPQDWLDALALELCEQYPAGEIIVSSGHSPSGTYHIGTLREIMTANAITWALRRQGRTARHIDFVDDFDAFRKVPKFVPEGWSRHIGQPLALVPDPFDCHDSYGTHFLTQLHEGLEALGAMPDETVHGYQTYRQGVLVDQLAAALDKLPEVRSVLTEVGGRQLDEHWSPVQILDETNNLRMLKFADWDSAKREITWRDRDGATGTVRLDEGRVKLDWRLDWPARWAKWGVSVEPFGRDHATKGGSYDTGRVLIERIFGGQAPYPVPYEFINTIGETKKMSKSTGNVLTPGDALEVMPPEILRYFVISARPSRTLVFDSGLGLYTLIDEYAKAQEHEPTGAVLYAQAASTQEMIAPGLPFNHLVAVYQSARQDPAAVKEILIRTGYEAQVQQSWPVIERELGFVQNWLAKYAPESVKFAVQTDLPKVELSQQQRAFLAKLAGTLETEKDLNGQGVHDAIYAAAQVAGLKPGQAFVALYRAFLGQDSGPKAGWFLASLEHDFVVERLREAATVRGERTSVADQAVILPDGRRFVIDPAISAAYGSMAIGYVVADITPQPEGRDWQPMMLDSLHQRGLAKAGLSKEPLIASWRQVYRDFGVKPSDYRSSVEALTRRVLDNKPPRVNSIVDLYNAISVAQLLSMGAMDLDHITGDISLRFGHEGEMADLLGMDRPVPVTDRQVVYADDQRFITWLWNHRDAKDTAVTLETKHAIFFVDGLAGSKPVGHAVTDLVAALRGEAGCVVLAHGVLASA